MAEVRKVEDPEAPAHRPETLPRIVDPIARAIEAERYSAYAEARARQARAIRDNALRQAREAGRSKPEIARLTGINVATVKAVLR